MIPINYSKIDVNENLELTVFGMMESSDGAQLADRDPDFYDILLIDTSDDDDGHDILIEIEDIKCGNNAAGIADMIAERLDMDYEYIDSKCGYTNLPL